MGGRGLASEGKRSTLQMVDNTDFNAFVQANMSNEQFKNYGKANGLSAVKDLWYKLRHDEEAKNLHEVPIEQAIQTLRSNVQSGTLDGWFRDANSDYKPKLLEQIANSPGTMNAGLNIAYYNYKNAGGELDFEKWLTTPVVLYRGTRGQKVVDSDIFTSYSADREVAEKFMGKTGNGKIHKIKIRPIDTYGSYQTTPEQEYLILTPKKRRK